MIPESHGMKQNSLHLLPANLLGENYKNMLWVQSVVGKPQDHWPPYSSFGSGGDGGRVQLFSVLFWTENTETPMRAIGFYALIISFI